MLEAKLRSLPRKLNILDTQAGGYQIPISTLTTYSATGFYQAQANSITDQQYSSQFSNGIVRLRDCDPSEIVYFTKNRVTGQVRKVPVMAKSKQKWTTKPETTVKQQAKQNEELFNYQKIMKQKHQRKQKFLEDIAKKIDNVQREAEELQEQFKQEGDQMRQIENIHSRMNQQFHNQNVNEKIGEMQKEIEETQARKNKNRIQLDMGLDQIKKAIQVEADLDRQVIDQADDLINRLRGKKQEQTIHIQKTKEKVPRVSRKIASPVTSSFYTTKKLKR